MIHANKKGSSLQGEINGINSFHGGDNQRYYKVKNARDSELYISSSGFYILFVLTFQF